MEDENKLGDKHVSESKEEKINLDLLKEENKVIRSSDFATIYDIGDGVICLQLHTRSSAINSELVIFMQAAQAELSKNWDGMVVAGAGRHFCVGADLTVVGHVIAEKDWKLMDQLLARTHDVYRANKYAQKPVVMAIHGMVLGGGCEMVIQSPAIQAAADSFVGLVELGVGLIPAGGGVKEAILKGYDKVQHCNADPAEAIWPYLENMALKKISTSARDAMRINYLQPSDGISLKPEYLLGDAKRRVLQMKNNGFVAPEQKPIPSFGTEALAPLKVQSAQLLEAGYISEYDLYIVNRIVDLMAGGNLSTGSMLSEEYIEELERELFISLCGQQKTQHRIAHMLKNGKPLRN